MIEKVESKMNTARAVLKDICTLDTLLLGMLLITVGFASVGFWFGKVCSPFYFWVSYASFSILSLFSGWRKAMLFAITCGVCWLMTAYTFSYSGTDAQNYHFPMQWLLRSGWNPVFDSTIEKFVAVVDHPEVDVTQGCGFLSTYHVLFLPKFTSLCGALVAKATHLWVADAFLGYCLIVSLFLGSTRFAKRIWNCRTASALLFALAITFSTKITSFLAGQVDYSSYAALCISLFSSILFVRDKRMSDLVLFVIATVIAMTVKSTGMICVCLLMFMLLPLLYRRVSSWVAVLIIGVCVLVIGASPLLTAWIQYGSPVYPTSTFNPLVQPVDITSDFTGNPDALSMGYLSRICYAWISPSMTTKVLALIRDNPDFSPRFTVCGGVAGYGIWFNMILLLSLLALCFSKKGIITYICVFIFISANFVPLKYIGYSRYFPQIWALAPIAFYNFVYTGSLPRQVGGRWMMAFVSAVLFMILFLLSALSTLRTTAYQTRMLVLEKVRQQRIELLRDETRRVNTDRNGYRYATMQRLSQAGLELFLSDEKEDAVSFQQDSAIPDMDQKQWEQFNEEYPICNGVADLIRFHWSDAICNIPHILWYH